MTKTMRLMALGLSVVVFTGCSAVDDLIDEYGDDQEEEYQGYQDGGDTDTGGTPPAVLKGTAAAGAPIIGHVIVKGANGNRVSEEVEADGTYDVDVSSLTAPYMLRVEGTVGGRRYELHSFAHESDVGGTINITPFTDLIVSNAARQMASNYFDSGDFSDMSEEEIDIQETALQEKLKDVFSELGIADTVDLLTTSFNADHTELDAALDMISIEYNTGTNTAILTNLIDNTTMEDNIVDDTEDTAGTLEVVTQLSTAETELVAIDTMMKAFTTMIKANNFTQTQLEAYLGDAFLDEDMSKAEWATAVSSADTSAIEFTNVVISDLNMSASTANVTFSIIWGGIDEDDNTWKVQKINDTWKILGNGEIVEYYGGFHCNRGESIHGFNNTAEGACGINVAIEDNNPNNNHDAGAILSAKVDIVRDGLPLNGSSVIMQENPNAPGEIYPSTCNYGCDWIGFDDIAGVSLQGGDKYRLQLFTSTDATGDVVDTYYDNIVAAPVTQATASDYPIIAQGTKDVLEDNFTGGNLTVSFTIPEGKHIDEVWYEAWDDNGNRIELDSEDGTNSVSFDVDLSIFSGSIVYQQIRVYSEDDNGQAYSTFYKAQDIIVP